MWDTSGPQRDVGILEESLPLTGYRPVEAMIRARATDVERVKREADALELLAAGVGSAFAVQTLAGRYGVSLRQARRYVSAAAFDLTGPLNPATLDSMAMLTLHRLDLISGQAMAAGDHALAVRSSKAHAAAVAQFRKAITAPVTRFRLPPTGPPATEPENTEFLPF